jgi:DNA-binding transcriptional LysR family regulator
MLDELRGLLVFAHVVDARSFSAAAKELGMTKSAVSKHVQQLEAQLGVQLLVRTTRKLSLTDVGERVHAASTSIRESAHAAREAATLHTGSVSGNLRITAPAVLGRTHLTALVTEFLERHPALSAELIFSDSFVDLVEERIDVALRVGRTRRDTSLVARRIADVPMLICAAPRYLAQRGRVRVPADLTQHEWVQHQPRPEPNRVTFHKGRRRASVQVQGRLSCDDGAAGVEAAIQGFGVVLGPDFELSDAVRTGRLVPLLTDWSLDHAVLSAVFPPRRHVSAKVRAFVDFVAERWKRPPWSLS